MYASLASTGPALEVLCWRGAGLVGVKYAQCYFHFMYCSLA